MHLTLHLSNQCNMRCRYCYVQQGSAVMSTGVLHQAMDLAARLAHGKISTIAFFGGEPLLHKDLILEALQYSRWLNEKEGTHFQLQLNTNGLLLEDDLLDHLCSENVFIALSIDGVAEAHNRFRLDAVGNGTHEAVAIAAKRLLARNRCSPAMMVVNPETAGQFTEGVDYLFGIGFRYLICSLNYAAQWSEQDFQELKKQYKRLSNWYYRHTLNEDKFYFSPFESKIASHIKGSGWCAERCELGVKRISVAPDGVLYPCVQFVGDKSYAIGHVSAGVDEQRKSVIAGQNQKVQPECLRCAIRSRCFHSCGCLNRQATGSIGIVSPVLCEHERMIMPIVDALASRLYKSRNAMFIQKHYNDMYPILSAIEDRGH